MTWAAVMVRPRPIYFHAAISFQLIITSKLDNDVVSFVTPSPVGLYISNIQGEVETL